MNKIISSIIICLVMISCEKENFSPVSGVTSNQSSSTSSSSSKCTGCSEWQKCDRVSSSSDPLDFFNTSYSYRCRSIFRNLRQGGYRSTQTFSDSTGNSIESTKRLYFPHIFDGYSATLDFGYSDNTNINIIFTSDYELREYYNFIVRNCVMYNPITQSNMIFEGTGSFTKNGSSCYHTVEINLQSTGQNGNFSYKLVGVSGS